MSFHTSNTIKSHLGGAAPYLLKIPMVALSTKFRPDEIPDIDALKGILKTNYPALVSDIDGIITTSVDCRCPGGEPAEKPECPDEGGIKCKPDSCKTDEGWEADGDACKQTLINLKFLDSQLENPEGSAITKENVIKPNNLKQIMTELDVMNKFGVTENAMSVSFNGKKIEDLNKTFGDLWNDYSLKEVSQGENIISIDKVMTPAACADKAKLLLSGFSKWEDGIKNILKGWISKVLSPPVNDEGIPVTEPDADKATREQNLEKFLKEISIIGSAETGAPGLDKVSVSREEVEKSIKEYLDSKLNFAGNSGSIITSQPYSKGKDKAASNLNKPPCRKSNNPNGIAEGKPGIPIIDRLKIYCEKLPKFASYGLAYKEKGLNLTNGEKCISNQEVVNGMENDRRTELEQMGMLLPDDLEDIGGSVRTVIKYRDHHLSQGKKFPIVNAVVKKDDPPKYGPGEHWPVSHGGDTPLMFNEPKEVPTCVYVDTADPYIQERINCGGLKGWPDTSCTSSTKNTFIGQNQKDCNYLITPGVLTNNTRYYGPFADVFDETNTNFDVYKRMGNMFEQLEKGYNITIFGFGFSGSGKTYTLLGSDSKDKNKGITQLAIASLKEKGYNNITCKLRELAPMHTHSRMTYYGLEGAQQEYKVPWTNADGTQRAKNDSEKVKSWKWDSNSGEVKLKDKNYDSLNAGTKLIEIDYDTYKDNSKSSFKINPADIDNLIEKVTALRVNALRISATPNNPQSSRGHLFLEFTIKKAGQDKGSKLTICDMAGSENTKEIKDAFFKQSMVTQKYLNESSIFDFPTDLKNICNPKFCNPNDSAVLAGKDKFPNPLVVANIILKSKPETDLAKGTLKREKCSSGTLDSLTMQGCCLEFKGELNSTEKIHKNIVFYFPSLMNSYNVGTKIGTISHNANPAMTHSGVEIVKNKPGIPLNGDIGTNQPAKESAFNGYEAKQRSLWIKYGLVKDVLIPDNTGKLVSGHKYEKFGYYESTLWDKNGRVGDDLKKLDNYLNSSTTDIKKSYYNAMDIWAQFYLKFIFGNDIKKEHFYHCLPEDIDTHPHGSTMKSKSEAIVKSIHDSVEYINKNAAFEWHQKSNTNVQPWDPSYEFPKDGGLDRIQIATEMKPKLVLPMYVDKDITKKGGNTHNCSSPPNMKNSPIDQLWSKPCSLANIDNFLAVNALVSPFDIEYDTTDKDGNKALLRYYIPPTFSKHTWKYGPDMKQVLLPLCKVIATFDAMVKKIEPMSGIELSMKKQWVLLRDMFVAAPTFCWYDIKDDITMCLDKIFEGVDDNASPAEKDDQIWANCLKYFHPMWVGAAIKAPYNNNKFKVRKLVTGANAPTDALKTEETGEELTYTNIEYVHSGINNFLLNYITLIVYQGDGIVATLDHLASYFKSQYLDSYGGKVEGGKINMKPTVEIDGQGTLRDTIMIGDKEEKGFNLQTIIDPKSGSYPGQRGKRLAERPRDSGQRFLMYETLKSLDDPNSISKYIMLTCILRGENYASTQGKYCKAAKNTLEFAQKVASSADSCLCQIDPATKSKRPPAGKKAEYTDEVRNTYTESVDRDQCQKKSKGGNRSIPKRSMKKKKYMSVNHKTRRVNRL
jgi:hypothetical protein